MKKLIIFVAAILLVIGVTGYSYVNNNGSPILKGSTAELPEASTQLFAMDTYMTITAYGSQAISALTEAETRIKEVEYLWSVTNPESEIYALNQSVNAPLTINPITGEVVKFALDMAKRTDGALEPTIYPVLTAWGFTTREYRIPSQTELDNLLAMIGYEQVILEDNQLSIPQGMQLDLGAVAKGYTADIVDSILREHDVSSALIDLGGNIQLIGAKPNGSKWRVGIKDAHGNGTIGVLEASDQAIVTSGGYERYFVGNDGETYWHIIDPATGRPANSGLLSVTVVGTEGSLCDALSTALFVMGLEEAAVHWKEFGDFEMILLTENNELFITEGLAPDFTLNETHIDIPVHVLTK